VPSRIRLGISSYTFPWSIGVAGDEPATPMSAADLLTRARDLGVMVVQVADNLPLHLHTSSELASLNYQARSSGIQVEIGTRGISEENILRYLDIAVLFGSPILRVVVDEAGCEPSPAQIVSLLGRHEAGFRRAGVTLAIENHDRLSSAVLAGIIESLGQEWVGICLDTVNSLGALEGPDLVIQRLGPLAVNLHVKDFVIIRSNANMGFDVRGCPVGAGRLDLERLFRSVGGPLREITAVLELWTPRQATIAQTVALEESWARRSFDVLARELQEARYG